MKTNSRGLEFLLAISYAPLYYPLNSNLPPNPNDEARNKKQEQMKHMDLQLHKPSINPIIS
jgi:hypothetical protein